MPVLPFCLCVGFPFNLFVSLMGKTLASFVSPPFSPLTTPTSDELCPNLPFRYSLPWNDVSEPSVTVPVVTSLAIFCQVRLPPRRHPLSRLLRYPDSLTPVRSRRSGVLFTVLCSTHSTRPRSSVSRNLRPQNQIKSLVSRRKLLTTYDSDKSGVSEKTGDQSNPVCHLWNTLPVALWT